MRGPALYQLFNVRRADVTQTSLQAALLRPFVLQPASQGIWADPLQNETMSNTHGTLEMRTGCEVSIHWKASQQEEQEMLKQSSCPEGRQVAAWFMACSTWRRLTAQTGEILRVGVCQQSCKSLLPVIQLAAFHNISPVVCHHRGYKLQDGTNKTFSAWNAFPTWTHKRRRNICNTPYHWNAVLLLAEVFLLRFL